MLLDVPGRDRLHQPPRLRRAARPKRSSSGNAEAKARDSGIEHDQIGEPYADAAETDGKTGRFARGQHERGAGLRQPRGEPAGSDLIKHGDGRAH